MAHKNKPEPENSQTSEAGTGNDLRLGQFLARAGLCSRREADAFLKEHVIHHNGLKVERLDYRLASNDVLVIDGKEVKSSPQLQIILLNKPVEYVCTHKAQKDQKTIFELLPRQYAKYFIAGRLDADSRGLLLLSNFGNVTQYITHPSFGIQKKYLVKTSRPLSITERQRAIRGLVHAGERLRFLAIEPTDTPARYLVSLSEGKNREIRRLLSMFKVEVVDLLRIQIGPFELGELAEGKHRTLSDSELNDLNREFQQRNAKRNENIEWQYDYGEIGSESIAEPERETSPQNKNQDKLLNPVRRRRSEAGRELSVEQGETRKQILHDMHKDRNRKVSSPEHQGRKENREHKNRQQNQGTRGSLKMQKGKNDRRKNDSAPDLPKPGVLANKRAKQNAPKYKLLIKRRDQSDSDDKSDGSLP
ncbi:MAG: rRNA pseudouridine synthase [Leptospiraceae bacterium]|nr:rRNA pseudouridine synthase [Leptospiraceae bacterium]